MDKLLQKILLYESLLPATQGMSGFFYSKDCDTLLHSSLIAATGFPNMDIKAARSPEGDWRRRPLGMPDCYCSTQEERDALNLGGSGSSISRDMFTGLLWYFWRSKDLDAAVAAMEYARKHDYIMGYGDPARICLMPNLTSLLAEIIYKLSNKKINYFAERHCTMFIPEAIQYPTNLVGYEAHIQCWQILLYGEVYGELSKQQKKVFACQAERRPDNPLHLAANGKWNTGDMNPAIEAMMHPRWPEDRLPTNEDYCTSWWISTDDPLKMESCSLEYFNRHGKQEEQPNGAEIVVIYRLIMEGK